MSTTFSDRPRLADRTHRAPLRTAAGRAFGTWLGVAVAVLTVLAVGIVALPRLWSFVNPFRSEQVDRSRPALLAAITDLADYRAASAQLNVVVDVEQDAKWVPSIVRGERTVLLAVGHVDAGVDLSGLDATALTVDEELGRVTVVVPHAQLRTPELDLEQTRVLRHQRGVLDRLGSTFGDAPAGEQKALRLAQTKLREAARASDVRTRAEANTAAMISGLVRGLGYDDVVVTFGEPAAPAAGAAGTEL